MSEPTTIQFETRLTKSDYRKLVYFNLFNRRRYMPAFFATALILSLVILLLRLAGLYYAPDYLYYTSLLFPVLVLMEVAVIESTVNKFIRSDKILIDSKRLVTITPEGISSQGGKESSNAQYTWEMFYKAYETKQHFMVFINIQQALILSKSDLSDGVPMKIRTLLTEKMGSKFLKRCR